MPSTLSTPSDPENELLNAIRERRISLALVTIVICLLAFDIVFDLVGGEPGGHVAVEAMVISLASIGAIYLWLKTVYLSRETNQLRTRLSLLHRDSEFWKKEAKSALEGLGESIDKHFSLWNLTSAERDIGLLLLKGYSHKEIAQLRETSDRTIRHQAASLYSKADLDGRAQLSAFFLEDLLLPIDQSSPERAPRNSSRPGNS